MAAIRIGVLSDTHGLLRPEVLSFLAGSNHVVHAGDVGAAAILARLATIAPLTAVRGNNDADAWALDLQETARLTAGEVSIHVTHQVSALAVDPPAAGVQVVITGHSHQPRLERRDGVLFLNPGSAGPRRFSLPIALAELVITGSEISARILTWQDGRWLQFARC